MSKEYVDIETGEEVTEDDLYERYDEALDELGPVVIGNLEYSASNVLKEVDPIAYRVGFDDWVDGELGETIKESDDA